MGAERLDSVLRDFEGEGFSAADLTAEELTALVHACDRMANPYSDINAELCGTPIKVCKDVYFWPLTAGAFVWLEEYAGKWWKDKPLYARYALAYAMANARDPDAFSKLTDKWTAAKALSRFALRLPLTTKELDAALSMSCARVAVPDDGQTAPCRIRRDYATIAQTLEAKTGITAKEWLFGRSFKAFVREHARLQMLQNATGDDEAAKKMDFELDDALTEYAGVKASIMARLRRAKSDGGENGNQNGGQPEKEHEESKR